MANEVAKKNTQFMSGLAKIQDTFVNMVVNTGKEIEIQYDEYQRTCVMNMLGKMQELLIKEGLDINKMDTNQITNILQTVAMLKLNASAMPRECYVILRNVKKGNTWVKEFELGVEGDGNDKILRTYGIDVDKVGTPWIVRENDDFTYSQFKGFEITPPTWSPKGTGKVIRVVYPIKKKDGSEEYHISERADVVHNLQAHISNNLMKNKMVDEKVKEKLNALAGSLDLDGILENKELLPHISPAWKSSHSREAMIVRKMRNNAIKKIPKDFENAFAALAYEKTFEEYEQYQEDERINKEEAVDIEVNEASMSEPVKTEYLSSNEPVSETKEIEQPVTHEEAQNAFMPDVAPY